MKKIFAGLLGILSISLVNNQVFAQYCSSTSSQCSVQILNVSLAGESLSIANPTNCSTGGYADYTAMKADLLVGSLYTMTTSNDAGANGGIGGNTTATIYVYIDWNQDFVFDNSEQVYTGTGFNPVGNASSSIPINVPTTASIGETRMRIRTVGTSNPGANVSCGNQSVGETEDYTIEVKPSAPPNCVTNAVPATGATNICLNTTLSWEASTTGQQASGYKVYFGTATNPPLVSDQTDLTYDVTNLSPNTTYYWNVIAYNATGDATGCAELTFTTSNLSVAITPDPAVVCANADLIMDGGPTGGVAPYTHTWSGNGATSLSATNFQNPTFNAASDGSYDLTYQVQDANGCTWEDSRTVTVNPADLYDVSIDITIGNDTICAGENVEFTSTVTTAGTNVVYDWQINGSSVASTPTFASTTLADQDVVSLVITPDLTCPESPTKTSNTFTMKVNPILTTAVDATLTTGNNPTCSGDNVEYTANPTNGGTAPSYTWQVNGVQVGTGPTYASTTYVDQDELTVTMTNNALCPDQATVTSGPITIGVIDYQVTSVSASITNGSNPSCEGSSIEFTATPGFGGATPSYEWFVNGVSSGTGATYTSSTLVDQDAVSVTMTSSFQCPQDPVVSSTPITVSVLPTDVTSVQIQITQGASSICEGTTVSFDLTSTGGGNLPNYEWYVSGVYATNGSTYTSDTLVDSDEVQVFMQSTAACPDQTNTASNIITMQVTPASNPSVSIALTGGTNPSCPNTSMQFMATPTDGGTNPSYTWRINGTPVASTSVFTFSGFVDQDTVDVRMVSNAVCAAQPTQLSNFIIVERTPLAITDVQITITQGENPSCSGNNIEFTANPMNGGTNPIYNWRVNAQIMGSGTTYSSSSLNDGDVVDVLMMSDESCPDSTTKHSNSIIIDIQPQVTPDISIDFSQGSNPVCAGSSAEFSATVTNGGSAPTYKWFLNNVFIANGPVFGSANFQDQDEVKAVIISNAGCASTNSDTSNIVVIQTQQPVPTSVEMALMDSTYCEGSAIDFYVSAQQNEGSAPTYVWYVNGMNAASGASYSPDSLQNGDMVQVAMISSLTCVDNDTVLSNSYSVSNVQPVDATVDFTIVQGNLPICEGTYTEFEAINYTNEGTAPVFSWYVNNVQVGTGTNYGSTTFADGDAFYIGLNSNAFCLNDSMVYSDTLTLQVNPVSIPMIFTEITEGSTEICEGELVGFKATSTDGGSAPTYDWYLNGNIVATDSIFSSSTFSDGDAITCVLTSNASCSANPTDTSVIYTMTVHAIAPAPQISTEITNGSLEICEGDYVGFEASSIDGGSNPAYTWYLNGTQVDLDSIYGSSNFSDGDEIFCTVTSDALCAVANIDSSGTYVLIVNAIPPTPTITQNGTTLTSSSATGNQWLKNGVDIPGATNVDYTYTENGFYSVRVIDVCPPDTSDLIDVKDASLQELAALNARVYPNPTQGEFTLDLATSTKGLVRIYDAYGRLVYETLLKGNQTKISLTDADAGLYKLVLDTENGSYTQNVVKF